MEFADHFSIQAEAYQTFRPGYPLELFSLLAKLADRRERVWDCATGNGQAALGLADHFVEVIATDASASQLARAMAHPRVRYRQAKAEASGLDDGSVDLITVAQALHWFDRELFFAEARRVARSGALLAVWVYGLVRIDPAVDRLVRDFFHGPLKPYWPPERRLVDELYASIDLPGEEIAVPQPAMVASWNLERLCGYLASWSAVARYRREQGVDPVARLRPSLAEAWGVDEAHRPAVWPLRLRVCQLP